MQAIQTRYKGPTNHTGARIVASAEGRRLTLGYDHGLGEGQDAQRPAAEALRDRLGWSGELVGGRLPDGSYAWVFAPAVERDAPHAPSTCRYCANDPEQCHDSLDCENARRPDHLTCEEHAR